METVEIVIKLPQNLYLDVKNGHASNIQRERVIEQVKNGTILPKNRGRLIILSEDAIKREQTFLGFSCQSWISDVSLSDATVAIIEADTESEEKEE